ncbi:hypothetical protein WICMUC_002570 [Wickerhamomyces mucosus]|uniref:Protein sym1 n=1 Tax=Wickerhamomyces mucosus TaxID=1378264 RepID=A0A9P8PP11_9ASCO|nr:hypothetical protein WICMUC_002570 [Wickerhamomyces mucosus]
MEDLEKSSTEIEKNLNIKNNHQISRSRSVIYFTILIKLTSIFLLLKNRDLIENVHQLLNSILLGFLTAGLAQTIIQTFRAVNFNKILKFALWGGISGISGSLWIDYLVVEFPKNDDIIYRVAVDQLVGAPFFQSLFLIYNCLWEGNNIKIAFHTNFLKTLLMSYLIWPASSVISFGYLPQHFIFPFTCAVGVVWTVILGLLN